MGSALLIALAMAAASQGTPPATFQADLAWNHLTRQVGFGPRVPGSPEHIKCRDYLLEEMKKWCDTAQLQEFTHTWSVSRKTIKMWNVVGQQNWVNAKHRVLLFAHWDTRPFATEEYDFEKSQKPIPGANDGASGVAVLLELMRVLKGRTGDLGILYVLTDGEDLGPGLGEMFLGAKHLAKTLTEPKPNYGILLDMIGDKDLRVPVEQNSFQHAKPLVQELYSTARSLGMGKEFPYVLGQAISDDHLPLIAAGVPSVDLIDFDYDPWHTLEDTVDKCSPESLGKVGRLLEVFLTKKPMFRMPSRR